MKKHHISYMLTVAFLVGALPALTACSDSERKTGIIVEVWTDLEIPEQLDEIRIDIDGSAPVPLKYPFALTGTKAVTLPLRIAVIPNGNGNEGFTVIARGFRGDDEKVNQTARTKFLSGETRVLTLVLGRDCVGKECGNASLTCSRGRCESIDRDPKSLPIFDPKKPAAYPDAAAEDAAAEDAGTKEDAGTDDGAAPDVMSCSPNLNEACGTCGGKVLCDGTCSVTTPENLQMACGLCNGTVSCDGTCSAPTPPNFGQACGSCGIVQCDGSCSKATPQAFGQSCGACGGKVQCDDTCSVATPPNLNQDCGSCGGKVKCDGTCSVATPPNFDQGCGSCGGKVKCDGTCSVATPPNFDQGCGSCGGKVKCDGTCSVATPPDLNVESCGCNSSAGLVPVLTADNSAVTQSGAYSSDYSGWNLFDSSMTTMWISEVGETPAWVGYEWSTPRLVTSYALTYANGDLTSRAPKDWQLQGSNGASWSTVDTRANQTNWAASPTRTYAVRNPGSYTKYRLLISDDNDTGAGIVVISLGNLALKGCQSN